MYTHTHIPPTKPSAEISAPLFILFFYTCGSIPRSHTSTRRRSAIKKYIHTYMFFFLRISTARRFFSMILYYFFTSGDNNKYKSSVIAVQYQNAYRDASPELKSDFTYLYCMWSNNFYTFFFIYLIIFVKMIGFVFSAE